MNYRRDSLKLACSLLSILLIFLSALAYGKKHAVLKYQGVDGIWWPKDMALEILQVWDDYPKLKFQSKLQVQKIESQKKLISIKDDIVKFEVAKGAASMSIAETWRKQYLDIAKDLPGLRRGGIIRSKTFWFFVGVAVGAAAAIGIGYALKGAR